jgi:hypothetical protein
MNFGIQDDNDYEVEDVDNVSFPTNYTHLQPGMPGYNQIFHTDQSMAHSSTNMPMYTYIIP